MTKVIRSYFGRAVILLFGVIILSCASNDIRITKPHEIYLYTTSDKRIMVYYNVFATRIDFTLKNITDNGFGDLRVEAKCSMKGGFIAEDFTLGELKQYFTKTFYTKMIHRDCGIITLDYSYIPLEVVSSYKSRKRTEDSYSTLPLSKRVSGNIIIKNYENRLSN